MDLGDVVRAVDVQIAQARGDVVLGRLLVLDRPRQQRPLGLGVKVRDVAAAAHRPTQRLRQPLLRQLELVPGRPQLGQLGAHRVLPPDQ